MAALGSLLCALGPLLAELGTEYAFRDLFTILDFFEVVFDLVFDLALLGGLGPSWGGLGRLLGSPGARQDGSNKLYFVIPHPYR